METLLLTGALTTAIYGTDELFIFVKRNPETDNVLLEVKKYMVKAKTYILYPHRFLFSLQVASNPHRKLLIIQLSYNNGTFLSKRFYLSASDAGTTALLGCGPVWACK
jgi:hypothetical protein